MIEVFFKILHGIYNKPISEGILHLAQDRRTRGHSLKLVTQHCKMEIRRNYCFSVRVVKPWKCGIRYLNLLCHAQLFRCFNPDWIKCDQVILFVSATRKSSDSKLIHEGNSVS